MFGGNEAIVADLKGSLRTHIATNMLKGIPDTHSVHSQVADFGLSQTGVTDGVSAITSKPGTAVFAAPELLRTGSLAAESDVYSFGVVAWHLISMGSGLADLEDIQVTYQVRVLVTD